MPFRSAASVMKRFSNSRDLLAVRFTPRRTERVIQLLPVTGTFKGTITDTKSQTFELVSSFDNSLVCLDFSFERFRNRRRSLLRPLYRRGNHVDCVAPRGAALSA